MKLTIPIEEAKCDDRDGTLRVHAIERDGDHITLYLRSACACGQIHGKVGELITIDRDWEVSR
jgi:hypothetical protein